ARDLIKSKLVEYTNMYRVTIRYINAAWMFFDRILNVAQYLCQNYLIKRIEEIIDRPFIRNLVPGCVHTDRFNVAMFVCFRLVSFDVTESDLMQLCRKFNTDDFSERLLCGQ